MLSGRERFDLFMRKNGVVPGWIQRRHKLLDEWYVARCAQRGVVAPQVIWWTEEVTAMTCGMIMWEVGDPELVSGSIEELPVLAYMRVVARCHGLN